MSSRVCGDCLCFHTDNCQHPSLVMGGDSTVIAADSAWACECTGWMTRDDFNSDS